jgi:hypothetical protein
VRRGMRSTSPRIVCVVKGTSEGKGVGGVVLRKARGYYVG